MTLVSNKLDNQNLALPGKELVKENMKLDLKSEMMKDGRDEVSKSMGNEEEEDELYNQVLKEAGIKNSEKMVGTSNDKFTERKVKNGPQKQIH